jgi:hypothetical protein
VSRLSDAQRSGQIVGAELTKLPISMRKIIENSTEVGEVGSESLAKNAITVGACESSRRMGRPVNVRADSPWVSLHAASVYSTRVLLIIPIHCRRSRTILGMQMPRLVTLTNGRYSAALAQAKMSKPLTRLPIRLLPSPRVVGLNLM